MEAGIRVPSGQVIGELGLLAPDHRRTQTFDCREDGELLAISYSSVKQLFFQNPKFGFYFLRLATERLFRDIARLEEELARVRAGADALKRPSEDPKNEYRGKNPWSREHSPACGQVA
jgi:CRP-like cAMP-binding protein